MRNGRAAGMRAKALALALVLLAGLGGAAFPWPWVAPAAGQEEAGQEEAGESGWIVSRIEGLLSGPGRTVTIGRIVPSGRLDVTIENLRIADEQGVWLTLHRAEVDWAPGALLRRELRIRAIEIARMTVERPPQSPAPPEQAPAEEEGGFSLPTLPDLPLVLDLRRVVVEQLELGAPVLGGEPAQLRVAGELRYAGAEAGLSADLDIRRTDERAGAATLDFDFAPGEDRLELDLTVDEPPGGILARSLDIPGLPAVEASWQGSGPLSAWRSQLVATAGEAASLQATATIDATGGQGYAASIDAQGSIDGLFADPMTARLVGPAFSLDGDALFVPGRRLEVETARIEAGPGAIALSGSYDLAGNRLDFDYRIEAGEDSTLQALVPEGGWRSALLSGSVSGPPAEPTLRLDLEADRVAVAGSAAERLALALTMAPAEPDPSSGGTVFDIGLRGDVDGLDTPYPAVPELVGGDLSLTAAGALVPDQGVIRVGDFEIAAEAVRLTGNAELTGWGNQGAGVLRAALPDLMRLEPLTGVPVSGSGETEIRWTLDPETLAVDADLAFQGLDSPDAALAPVIAEAVGRDPRLRLDGSVGLESGRIAVTGLQADLAAGTLAGSATLEDWGAAFDGTVRLAVPEMARLAGLVGQPLTGAATLSAELDEGGEAEILRARVTGTLEQAGIGVPAADALLGPQTDLAADVVVARTGAILVQDAVIEGDPATVQADARWQDGTLSAEWDVALPELSVLADPLGTALGGELRATGTLEGPPSSLAVQMDARGRNLLVAGTRLPTARLSADARNLPAAPAGHIDLETTLQGTPVALASDFDLATPGRLALDDLALGTGDETLTGQVEVALATGTATGRLSGRIGSLDIFSGLAGQPLAGEAGIVLALSAPQGRQAVAFEIDSQGLRVGLEDEARLAAESLRLDGRVEDLLADPRIDARLSAEGLEAGGVEADTLIASAAGGLRDLRFEADAVGRGNARSPGFGLSTAGALSLDAGQRLRLERLIANYGGEAISLVRPASIVLGPNRYVVEDLLLRVRDARIAADLTVAPDSLGGRAVIEGLPLDLLRLVDPGTDYRGRLDGELQLAGTPRDPRGDLTLAIADFQGGAGLAGDIGALDVALTGAWREGRLGLDGRVTGVEGIELDVRAGLPLVLDPGTLVPAVPAAGSLDGRAVGEVRLDRLNDLLAGSGDRVGGRLGIDLRLAGTVETPVVGGSAQLAGGSYENVEWGTRLTDVEAVLRGEGTRFILDRLTGRTPGGGSISASGRLDLAAEGADAIDIRLQADDATVAQVDLITAILDGQLAMTGPWDLPVLAGALRIDRAVIHLPQGMPPQVVELDVVEVHAGEPIRPATEEEEAEAQAPFAAALDIALTAPNQIYVRGRGLDAEFGADLRIGGTTSEPRIAGQLPLVRGDLSLLAKRFEFERATVTFRGGSEIDPTIDLLATASAEDVTAQIRVTGLASSPELELESSPPLPDDEILARILFNEPVSELSPFQAVALAQSLSNLLGLGGGGPGVLERIQEGLGIDRLEITGGGGAGAEDGTQIEAGRYVSEDVYVGIEQGVAGGGGGTRAVVELDVTDNIKARSRVGGNKGASVGIGFEWEY